MPSVAQLRHATFTDPGSQAALAARSATHELVLIGTRDVMPEDGVSQLRRILAPRRIVVLLIDDHLPSTERALIEELSNDGTIPVILTRCEFIPPDLTSWLDSDEPAVQQQGTHRTARRRRTLVHRPVIRHPGIDRGTAPSNVHAPAELNEE
jgi:hypothetical protein